MLEIQNQPQVQAKQAVSFKGSGETAYRTSPMGNDYFDRDSMEAERDAKVDEINQSKQSLDDLADELENTDNKVSKKAGKGIRIAATLLGLAGTFVMAKYSSKLVIETLKNAANSPAIKSTVDSVRGLGTPIRKAADGIKQTVIKAMENPAVKKNIDALKANKFVQKAGEFMKNEKVAKVLKPIEETMKSIRDIKLNGKSIQAGIENTMAAVTTGSVLVDDLTGRNNHKSNVELATGV